MKIHGGSALLYGMFYLINIWSVKGTASEGLMWNGQICIHKDDRCHNNEGVNEL